jgi:hypothetical protein
MSHITTREAELRYNRTRHTILMALRKGSIKGYKQYGRWYLNEESVKEYFISKHSRKIRKVKTASQEDKERDALLVQLLDLIRDSGLESHYTVSLRKKPKRGAVIEYPARTICSCDGEVYNTLMNWAYKNKIVRHKAFDTVMEKFQDSLGKFKQRPKEADNASMRYWKSKPKINEKKSQ